MNARTYTRPLPYCIVWWCALISNNFFVMSSENITEATEPLRHTVKLYGTDKSKVFELLPDKDVFALKRHILDTTSWFPGSPPSKLVLNEEGKEGETDSPTKVKKDCTFVVRLTPKNAVSVQVSSDRKHVSNPHIRPQIDSKTLEFLSCAVEHVVLVDTSVVKAVMYHEIATLPLRSNLAYLSTKRVKEECRDDTGAKLLALTWPSYIKDCGQIIKGFTQDKQTLLYKELYTVALAGRTLDGVEYPEYEDFEDQETYVNSRNDLVIYLEALLLSRYVRSQRGLRVSFLTFDANQGFLADHFKRDAASAEWLTTLVEPDDIRALNVITARDRDLSLL
jgi:hypothetical protein